MVGTTYFFLNKNRTEPVLILDYYTVKVLFLKINIVQEIDVEHQNMRQVQYLEWLEQSVFQRLF